MVESKTFDLSGFKAILTPPRLREKSRPRTTAFSFYTETGLKNVLKRETPAARFSGVKAITISNHPSKFERARRTNLTQFDRARLPQLEKVYEQALQELKALLKEYAVFSRSPDLLAEAAISALAEQGNVSESTANTIRSVCQTHFETEERFLSKWDKYKEPAVGFMTGNSVPGGLPITFISEADLRQAGKNMDQFIRKNCRFLT